MGIYFNPINSRYSLPAAGIKIDARAVVDRLDKKLGLGLALVPDKRVFLQDRISFISSSDVRTLAVSLDTPQVDLKKLNFALSPAGLEAAELDMGIYRISEKKKKSINVLDVLKDGNGPVPGPAFAAQPAFPVVFPKRIVPAEISFFNAKPGDTHKEDAKAVADDYKMVYKAANSEAGAGFIMQKIITGNFDPQLYNERQIIKLVLRLAVHEPYPVAEHYKIFKITDKKVSLRIANIIAERSGIAFAFHYRVFDIDDPRELKRLFMKAMNKDVNCIVNILRKVQETGLDKKDLMDIYRTAAKLSGFTFSEYVGALKITDVDDRIEFFKIAAKQDAKGASRYFRNYDIQSEDTRAELLLYSYQIDPEGTLKHISEYQILDPRLLKDPKMRIKISDLFAEAKLLNNEHQR